VHTISSNLDEIVNHFQRFGLLVADWPHKSETKSYYPPKGYAFLIFQNEQSVQSLIKCCMKTDDNKYYTYVSSPTMKDKVVQVRPWCATDADYVMDPQQPLEPRRTIFVGGVPRPLKAGSLFNYSFAKDQFGNLGRLYLDISSSAENNVENQNLQITNSLFQH
jgi:hypothetical protein